MSENKKILVLKAKERMTFERQDCVIRKLRADIKDGIVIIPDNFEYEWIGEDELKQIENAMISFLPFETKPTIWERIKRRFNHVRDK